MPESIFDKCERTDFRLPFYFEGPFSYLNKTARPEAVKIRTLIEDWVEAYPVSNRKKLINWLRNDNKFDDAFFELFTYTLMRKLGYGVEVDPKIDGQTPDFKINNPDDGDFILEVSVSKGVSDEQVKIDKVKDAVRGAINAIEEHKYFIGLRFIEEGHEDCDVAYQIKEFAQNYLGSSEFESDELQHLYQNSDPAIIKTFEKDGWLIQLSFTPRNKPSSESTPNCLGIEMSWFGFNETPSQLMRKVKHKANKYRSLSIPLLLGVNSQSNIVNNDSYIKALYGELQTIEVRELKGISRFEQQHKSGLFVTNSGYKFDHVSGVFGCIRVSPWNLNTTKVCLYSHPRHKASIEGMLPSLPQAHVNGCPPNYSIENTEGAPITELLELPRSWPLDD